MDVADAGRLGAEKRRQITSERYLEVARKMAADPNDPRLYPPLILTRKDRL